MTTVIRPHRFSGTVQVPSSKSHSIRRLLVASLAEGVSEIKRPLDSLDTKSCISVFRTLGAEIIEHTGLWAVRGMSPQNHCTANNLSKSNSKAGKRCDVGNSGTTLFFALAAAALGKEPVEFDGDEQIRHRSAGLLLDALAGLGVSVKSASGCAPVSVRGPWKGGRVSISCPTSQYLSALLLTAPMAPAGVITEIDVPLLNERPYIEMTLSYMDAQKIPYETTKDFSYFRIPGGSVWQPVSGPVPGDFSSAVFLAAAAVISGGSVKIFGLDPGDIQGDKAFFGFFEKMGCNVQWDLVAEAWQLKVSPNGPIVGGDFDLNATPDLFPALAAVACFARGDTALLNVASARIKETDRIAVMAEELRNLGVKTTERPDGLIVHGTGGIFYPCAGENYKTDGRGDHRIVMALACAALGCPAPVEIASAESAAVSYPGFIEMLAGG